MKYTFVRYKQSNSLNVFIIREWVNEKNTKTLESFYDAKQFKKISNTFEDLSLYIYHNEISPSIVEFHVYNTKEELLINHFVEML